MTSALNASAIPSFSSAPSLPDELFLEFNWLGWTIKHTRYALVSAYAIQLYEWLETLPQEFKHIHTMSWSSIKAAYLLCRYYPLIFYPFIVWLYSETGTKRAEDCYSVLFAAHFLTIPYLLLPQGVMVVRAYAFSDKKPFVLYLLCALFAALLGCTIWTFALHPPLYPSYYYQNSGIPGCYPNYATSAIGVKFVLLETVATVMDFISLVVVINHCRKELMNRSGLARFFLGQGLWAFGVVLSVNAATLGIFFLHNTVWNRFGLPYTIIICNIVACRVVLQLISKARDRCEETITGSISAHSSVEMEPSPIQRPDSRKMGDC